MSRLLDALRSKTIPIPAWVVAASLLTGGFIIFAEFAAVCQSGSSSVLSPILFYAGQCLLTLSMFSVVPFLLCMLAPPVAAACCLARRTRPVALVILVSCLLFLSVCAVSMRIGSRVRRNAFIALAERSTTLVDTIRAYQQQHGEPPASLDAIVPEFIAEIPTTGIGAYPEYRYYVAKKDFYNGNPWVLSVSTSKGVLDFDEFMYYPLQNYPPTLRGNGLERVRDWVYMHE